MRSQLYVLVQSEKPNSLTSFEQIKVLHAELKLYIIIQKWDVQCMYHYAGEEKYMQGFVGETWGKRPHGRPRHRWEENIKMDLQEVG